MAMTFRPNANVFYELTTFYLCVVAIIIAFLLGIMSYLHQAWHLLPLVIFAICLLSAFAIILWQRIKHMMKGSPR